MSIAFDSLENAYQPLPILSDPDNLLQSCVEITYEMQLDYESHSFFSIVGDLI